MNVGKHLKSEGAEQKKIKKKVQGTVGASFIIGGINLLKLCDKN